MLVEAIGKIVDNKDLSFTEAKEAMQEIMAGQATPAQIGGFLTALRLKGEKIDEITGFATAMRECCVEVKREGDLLEIVGTGGDKANTFNISTTAGIVVAAGGVKVAKHGNRGVSSKCGAADCLEALGINLQLDAKANAQMLAEVGMCFMFAPVYHQSMKYAAPVRKELGLRTVFNVLGPLSNPANANIQLMGVYDKALVEPLARVLANLGVKRGAVVHGMDGLDEITACTTTYVCEINNGKFNTYELDPKGYGYDYVELKDLVGGDKFENAQITKKVLAGEKDGKRTAVVLNAGMALYLAGKANSLAGGFTLAEDLIDSGKAREQLEKFISCSNQLS